MSKTHWWKGARGEWYVVIQLLLFALVVFGPRKFSDWPKWTSPYDKLGLIVGSVLLLIGGLLVAAAAFKLRSNITPLPYPKEQAMLVETGPYRIVRHPMYSGAIIAAFGWAFLVHGWLTIGYAMILFVFFDIKSRREERWLNERFSGYIAYRKRVHKLIPFIY